MPVPVPPPRDSAAGRAPAGPPATPQQPKSVRRLLAIGLAAALLAGAIGGAWELWRFGTDTAASARRVEAGVQRDFSRMTDVLSRVAADVAGDPDSARALIAGADAQRALFDVLDRHTGGQADDSNLLSVTIYDAGGAARAWMGRPSDIRATSAADYFVTPSPLGLRLVHVAPIADRGQSARMPLNCGVPFVPCAEESA